MVDVESSAQDHLAAASGRHLRLRIMHCIGFCRDAQRVAVGLRPRSQCRVGGDERAAAGLSE